MNKKRTVAEIAAVERGSIAWECGIRAGDILLSINGEKIVDIIDYEYFSGEEILDIELSRAGEIYNVSLEKDAYRRLGMEFTDDLLGKIRQCRNNCVFCFVDQMPPGHRDTLYIKDDDWRMSVIMGNYVTLTNVSQQELDRIMRRKISELYISVHATDPRLRVEMLRNPSAGNILGVLKQLAAANVRLHMQIVLCPGLNDGEQLHRTISDLIGLIPAAISLSVVPVGLTRYRENLYPLSKMTREQARETIGIINGYQKICVEKYGTRFVFASDEMFVQAELPPPPYEEYEDFPQIDNGVGMVRLFERDYIDEWSYGTKKREHAAKLLLVTGVAYHQILKSLVADYPVENAHIDVLPIENHYFGRSVDVSGLVTGGDLIKGVIKYVQESAQVFDYVIMPRSMLRMKDGCTLDDMYLSDIKQRTGIKIIAVEPAGSALYAALTGEEE